MLELKYYEHIIKRELIIKVRLLEYRKGNN